MASLQSSLAKIASLYGSSSPIYTILSFLLGRQGSGGGSATGLIDTIRWAPGVVSSDPRVVQTWAELQAIRTANPATTIQVQVDDSAGTPTVPAGSYNVGTLTWTTYPNLTAMATVELADGAEFVDLREMSSVIMMGDATSGPSFKWSNGTTLRLTDHAYIGSTSGDVNTMFVANGNTVKVIIDNYAGYEDGIFTVAGVVNLELLSHAVAGDFGANTGLINLQMDLTSRKPNLGGASSFTPFGDASFVNYDDAFLPQYGSATVQGALDELKGVLELTDIVSRPEVSFGGATTRAVGDLFEGGFCETAFVARATTGSKVRLYATAATAGAQIQVALYQYVGASAASLDGRPHGSPYELIASGTSAVLGGGAQAIDVTMTTAARTRISKGSYIIVVGRNTADAITLQAHLGAAVSPFTQDVPAGRRPELFTTAFSSLATPPPATIAIADMVASPVGTIPTHRIGT